MGERLSVRQFGQLYWRQARKLTGLVITPCGDIQTAPKQLCGSLLISLGNVLQQMVNAHLKCLPSAKF
jgi:hypothetical protein